MTIKNKKNLKREKLIRDDFLQSPNVKTLAKTMHMTIEEIIDIFIENIKMGPRNRIISAEMSLIVRDNSEFIGDWLHEIVDSVREYMRQKRINNW